MTSPCRGRNCCHDMPSCHDVSPCQDMTCCQTSRCQDRYCCHGMSSCQDMSCCRGMPPCQDTSCCQGITTSGGILAMTPHYARTCLAVMTPPCWGGCCCRGVSSCRGASCRRGVALPGWALLSWRVVAPGRVSLSRHHPAGAGVVVVARRRAGACLALMTSPSLDRYCFHDMSSCRGARGCRGVALPGRVLLSWRVVVPGHVLLS